MVVWWWWCGGGGGGVVGFLPIIIPHQPSCFVLLCVVGWIVAKYKIVKVLKCFCTFNRRIRINQYFKSGIAVATYLIFMNYMLKLS